MYGVEGSLGREVAWVYRAGRSWRHHRGEALRSYYETRGRSRVHPVEADGTAATYDMVETALPTSAHFEKTPKDGRAGLESGEIVRAVASPGAVA